MSNLKQLKDAPPTARRTLLIGKIKELDKLARMDEMRGGGEPEDMSLIHKEYLRVRRCLLQMVRDYVK